MGVIRDFVRVLGVLCLSVLTTVGSDINPGYTFTSGERNVTHTKLNNLVDAASINTSFFTDKSAAAPASSDTFLFYSASAGAFRKTTYNLMLLSQTNIIDAQSEYNTPATNDYVLVQTGALLKKSSLNALTWTNADLIVNRTNWATPNFLTTYFLAYDSANNAYSKVNRSNLFYNAATVFNFTGLATRATPINNDKLLIYNSTDSTNAVTTLAGLITNSPAVATPVGTDVLWGYRVAGATIGKFTVDKIRDYVTNSANSPTLTNALAVKFTSFEYAIAAGAVGNTNHSLGAVPQHVRWVLVNKTAELNYAIGDEIAVTMAQENDNQNPINGGANATNVFCLVKQDTFDLLNKTTGAKENADATKWRLKCYATYFP